MTDPIPIRLSHLIGFCAPGAIVRSADMLMVPMDTRYWTKKGYPKGPLIQQVKRLQKALGIGPKPLHFPPRGRMSGTGKLIGDTLPAVRFPSWMHCEHCGRLYFRPWNDPSEKDVYCTHPDCPGKTRLDQVPWVLFHPKGYLDDIPWHWLAHRRQHKPDSERCKVKDQLFWKDNVIRCKACGASNHLSIGAMVASDFFSRIALMRQQPWIDQTVPENELQGVPPVAVQVGDVRIHEPQISKGLVIPPESRMTAASPRMVLESMPQRLDILRRLRTKNPRQFQRMLDHLARRLRFSSEALKAAVDEMDDAPDMDDFSGDLLGDEFEALTTPIPDMREDEQFVTDHVTPKWRSLSSALTCSARVRNILGLVDKVVAVQRLREVVVYKGFVRRVAGREEEIRLVPPDIEGRQNWVPALELFGEGIFVSLKEEAVGSWERNEAVIRRCRKTARRLGSSEEDELPRYILLHTLAHLMIRQIEFDSGYPAAALKERLYSRGGSGGGKAMAGILIYTAVPDVAGSLGGLVEIARPERLLAMLERVFNHAEWCALDPICAEHDGQGPGLLNRAACHACTLLPEPSCDAEKRNTLLDRALIKGAAATEERGNIPRLLDCVD